MSDCGMIIKKFLFLSEVDIPIAVIILLTPVERDLGGKSALDIAEIDLHREFLVSRAVGPREED